MTIHANQKPNYSEFSDPRLVAIYDDVNQLDGYEDFYLKLADDLSAETVLDVGCGTGLVSLELSKRGHQVIGVEPSAHMVEIARSRAYPTPASFTVGNIADIKVGPCDLAIMTGHVAQFFVRDSDWSEALKGIHSSLMPGGHIAFESRNPLVQPRTNDLISGFAGWPDRDHPRSYATSKGETVEWWPETISGSADRILYENRYRFTSSGKELASTNELIFRSQHQITQSLEQAGFTIQKTYGNWDFSPFMAKSPEMIFVAYRD